MNDHVRLTMAMALAATALACETKRSGMVQLCSAAQASGADAKPKGDRYRTILDWLELNVTDSFAKEVVFALPKTTSSEKPALIRAAAQDVGLQECPLADYLENLTPGN